MWQKLTIDWPCALGDWLWAVLVLAPALFLDRLTWRNAMLWALRLAMLWVLVHYAVEIASLDLTFLFTLDATVYWEAGAMLIMLTARGLPRQMLGAATRFLVQTVRVRLLRFARRARRTRSMILGARPPQPDRGEDEGGLAWTFAAAGAFA